MRFLSLFFILFLLVKTANSQSTPTWSDNVASIIYQNCSGCHHTGGIAPFSLMSYSDVQGFSSSIFNAVSNDIMPPWPPDTTYRRFAHERVLTVTQKQEIISWLNNGMTYGNPANEPTPPVFSEGSQLAVSPTVSVRIPDYTVSSTTDIYRCFVIPSGITQDGFIKGFELLPGNRSIVHHVLVFQDTTGSCANLDAADPGPGYTSFGGVGSNSASLIAAWVPGSSPRMYPAGMGIPIKAGSDLVLQIHYPAGVAGEMDSTRINLVLDFSPGLRPLYISPVLDHGLTLTNGPLIIPPNQISTFYNQYTTPALNFTVLDVAPHMHLLGKSIQAYGLTPVGDTIPFIRINNWDFHWQGSYSFRKLLKLPPLTVLKGQASYDNTVNNPNNPNSPPQYVFLGEATTDEMMLIYFTYTPYYPGDENIIQDSTLLSTGIMKETNLSHPAAVYPNPAVSNLRIYHEQLSKNQIREVRLYDMAGKTFVPQMVEKFTGGAEIEFPEDLSAGFYLGKIITENGSLEFKFVKN